MDYGVFMTMLPGQGDVYHLRQLSHDDAEAKRDNAGGEFWRDLANMRKCRDRIMQLLEAQAIAAGVRLESDSEYQDAHDHMAQYFSDNIALLKSRIEDAEDEVGEDQREYEKDI